MNFSEISFTVDYNNSDYEITFIEVSELELISEFENITDKYELLVYVKNQLQSFLVDQMLFDVAIPLTFLYSLVLIFGVSGNVITCIVILKNPTLRNATNYYLFSLAVSDLILLINGMILDFRNLWKLYPWLWGLAFCKLLHFSYSVAYNVSVLTVLAVSFERYLAICHPLRFNSTKRLKKPIGFIASLWIFGSIFSSIHLFRHITKYVLKFPSGLIIDPEIVLTCELTESLNMLAHEHLHFVFFFFLPMLVIFILYVKMGRTLRQNSISTVNSQRNNSFIRQLQSRRSTIRMLRVVIIVTFICWAPNSLIFLFEQTGSVQSLEFNNYYWVTYISDLFFYASTIVNPVIYNLMSTRYREAFKKTLTRKHHLNSKSVIENEYSKQTSP